MRACPERASARHAHHDGELGAFGRWRLERHLAVCQGCSAAMRALDAIGEAARVEAGVVGAPDLWAGISARLPAVDAAVAEQHRAFASRVREALRRRGLVTPVGVGAALAAAAVAGVLLLRPAAPPDHVVRALDGEGHVVLVLPSERDATIIWVMDDGGGAGDPAPL